MRDIETFVHSDQDRGDHLRLKEEGHRRLRRLRRGAAEAVRLGGLLEEVRARGLYTLDGKKDIFAWAWGAYKIRPTQSKKYLKIGVALTPQQVRRRVVSIDVLYEVAMASPVLRDRLLQAGAGGRREGALRGDRLAAEAVLRAGSHGESEPDRVASAEQLIMDRVRGIAPARPAREPDRALLSCLQRAVRLLSPGGLDQGALLAASASEELDQLRADAVALLSRAERILAPPPPGPAGSRPSPSPDFMASQSPAPKGPSEQSVVAEKRFKNNELGGHEAVRILTVKPAPAPCLRGLVALCGILTSQRSREQADRPAAQQIRLLPERWPALLLAALVRASRAAAPRRLRLRPFASGPLLVTLGVVRDVKLVPGVVTQPPVLDPDARAVVSTPPAPDPRVQEGQDLMDRINDLLDAERYEEARPLLYRELALLTGLLGEENPATLWVLNTLAFTARAMKDPAEEERMLLQERAIRERLPGSQAGPLSLVLYFLGSLRHRQHRFEDAEDLYEQALELRSREHGPDDPQIMSTQRNLARVHKVLERQRNEEAATAHPPPRHGAASSPSSRLFPMPPAK